MLAYRKLCVAALLAVAPIVALAQSWSQPWFPFATGTAAGPSFLESRVIDCFPTKTTKIALLDDFIADGRAVRKVVWWGHPATLDQIRMPYLIAFYKSDPTGACKPNLDLFTYQCVMPRATAVGVDCRGRKIYKFVALLPFWFIAAKGEKHWIQISEVDSKSVRPGVVDFYWAFHQRTPNYPSWTSCQALGFDSSLGLFAVTDPCNKEDIDMAFELWN